MTVDVPQMKGGAATGTPRLQVCPPMFRAKVAVPEPRGVPVIVYIKLLLAKYQEPWQSSFVAS